MADPARAGCVAEPVTRARSPEAERFDPSVWKARWVPERELAWDAFLLDARERLGPRGAERGQECRQSKSEVAGQGDACEQLPEVEKRETAPIPGIGAVAHRRPVPDGDRHQADHHYEMQIAKEFRHCSVIPFVTRSRQTRSPGEACRS